MRELIVDRILDMTDMIEDNDPHYWLMMLDFDLGIVVPDVDKVSPIKSFKGY